MAIGASLAGSVAVSLDASVSFGAGGAGAAAAAPGTTLLLPFRFQVRFRQASSAASGGGELDVCRGAFAEITGLEATMEPKTIKAGGLNAGAWQRAGGVSYATVVLKRGMTDTPHLWQWFARVAGGATALRLDAEIEHQNAAGEPVLVWGLARCLPVKFKAGDLNARGNEVAIEELHLVHEGLRLILPGEGA